MYDIDLVKDRIYELRKNRWELYKANSLLLKNPYEKYSCCKSQEALASDLHIERRAIGSWERGASVPSFENLVKLCNLLDCNIEYFLGADEIPEISPISKASHYSGIDPEIITYCLNHPDYLDWLNYFMHPKRCSSLFDNMTLIGWKTFLNDQELSDINDPLKNYINDTFFQFYSSNNFDQLSPESYKAFLTTKLPEKLLSFTSKTEALFYVKECISAKKYRELNLSKNGQSRYDDFIDFLVVYTYEPLMSNIFLEVQRGKIANTFAKLFTDYLSEL